MTSVNDDLKDRANNLGKGRTLTDGVTQTAFGDPTGEHPRFEYQHSSSVNIGARTGKMHKLSFGGAVNGIPASATSALGNQYPLNDVRETVSGHVLEFNDTPGGERILIKHNSGSGVEMRPDGTVVVSALGNKIEVCGGDNTVIVEGDAKLIYKGNLTLDVTGDLNINCMNYNVNARGDKKEDVAGSSRNTVFGNYGMKISGNKSETVAQSVTHTYLGKTSQIIKGGYFTSVQGKYDMSASDCVCMTSEKEIITSSPNINMAATSLSVFGATGTIGGENVIHYGKNYYGVSATMSAGITAPTFHGDVDGTAAKAVIADVTNSQNYADPDPGGGVGSAQGYSITNTATDTTATAKPTANLLTTYLTKSSKGVKQVLIDAGDFIKNALQTKKAPTPEEAVINVRAKLRDPVNLANPEFTASAIGAGLLSPNFTKQAPPSGFGRIRAPEPGCERGTVQAGNTDPAGGNKTFRRQEVSQKRNRTLLPDPNFNVDFQPEINMSTKLAPGITMAKFVGTKTAGDFKSVAAVDKLQLARNYYLHSQILKYVMTRPGPQPSQFADFRVEVVEAFYSPDRYGVPVAGNKLQPEVLTENSLLWKRNKGLVVVYEVINEKGEIDPDATFDIATMLKDKCGHMFEKMTLDYDEYDPSGVLNVQLIIEIKPVLQDYAINSSGLVETLYNGVLQGKNSLIEIVATVTETPAVVPETPIVSPPVAEPAPPPVAALSKEQKIANAKAAMETAIAARDAAVPDFKAGKISESEWEKLNDRAGDAVAAYHEVKG
jgi:hypothetical protein